ncbi:MAG: peptide-N-glycosidase F-related protein [Polyangiaceae bacterium]
MRFVRLLELSVFLASTSLVLGGLSLAAPSCGGDGESTGGSGAGGEGATGPGGMGGAPGTGGAGGEAPTIDACEVLGLPALAFDSQGPFGTLRNERADDFSVPLLSGETWTLSERWSGCESYVFMTSARTNSGLDDTSIWARDIDQLIARSPKNAHYLFVANRDAAIAQQEQQDMQGRIDTALATLSQEDREWWQAHLHVVAAHASEVEGWVGTVLAGLGRPGFAIDRAQNIRTVGLFADVTRFSAALNTAGEWPWESNMAYASYEVRHYNYEAEREARLAAETDVTIVTPWDGEVLAEEVETDVTFPSATEMAAFDHFEIDLTMQCPDPQAGEFGNCGAWDYLVHIYLQDEDQMGWTELGRFISTYHRQGRYVVDATAALPLLAAGGQRHLRYSISPPWNPQAYLTKMDFRLSNRGKGYRPTSTVPLFTGGDFNSLYNDAYVPIDVPIPATATHVELWAVITGHGGATNNCAEFCDHQHQFDIDGMTYLRTQESVGQQQGCIAEVDHGMVPNQGGTWWYGRGGWCPGQQVEPWVVDVTADVTPGATATISYQGLFNGGAIPDDSGNIVMNSYLVIYE